MKKLLKPSAFVAAFAAISVAAHAIPQLRIFDGTTTLTVTDNDANDASSSNGVVTWNGTIGIWNINVDTGLTKPLLGSASNPYLELNFVDFSSGAGTLTLSFTDTDFGPTFGGAFSAIGGTTAGTIGYATYGGTSNTPFDTFNLLSSQGLFSAGSYSGSAAGGSIANDGPYSLTQVITITHRSSGVSSGDAELRVPEGGTSIAMLGMGICVLGLYGRRRRDAWEHANCC
jgi:hypothetical protein